MRCAEAHPTLFTGAVHGRGQPAPGERPRRIADIVGQTMSSPPTTVPDVSVLMSVYNGEPIPRAGGGEHSRPDVRATSSSSSSTTARRTRRRTSCATTPSRDPRIKLTVRPNKGLTSTLNEAFAQSRGEFLARMDCDDVALPDALRATGRAACDADPDVVCVGGYFQLIDGAGRMLTTLRPPTDDAEIQPTLLAGHGSICHPAAMIRRDAMEQIGGYDEAVQHRPGPRPLAPARRGRQARERRRRPCCSSACTRARSARRSARSSGRSAGSRARRRGSGAG